MDYQCRASSRTSSRNCSGVRTGRPKTSQIAPHDVLSHSMVLTPAWVTSTMTDEPQCGQTMFMPRMCTVQAATRGQGASSSPVHGNPTQSSCASHVGHSAPPSLSAII